MLNMLPKPVRTLAASLAAARSTSKGKTRRGKTTATRAKRKTPHSKQLKLVDQNANVLSKTGHIDKVKVAKNQHTGTKHAKTVKNVHKSSQSRSQRAKQRAGDGRASTKADNIRSNCKSANASQSQSKPAKRQRRSDSHMLAQARQFIISTDGIKIIDAPSTATKGKWK